MATVDLRPGKLNVKTSRGDTVGLPITIQEGGVPADLSGRTFTAQLRKSKGSATAITITVDTSDAATGVLVLRIDEDVTEALSGDYQWDLQQVMGSTARTILAGRWSFLPDVTREVEL